MTAISKSASVPYSAEQMYELVNDVESYPTFLPWCHGATIICSGDVYMTASITLSKGKIKQTFTTRNNMISGRRIEVSLVEGPFKYLEGNWTFEPEGENSCNVSIQMEFEFSNRILKMAMEKVFTNIVNTLIATFTERAHEIYGER